MIFSESISSRASLSANDRKVGWVANVRLQPFLFSGRDEFIRSGLKIKVGRMVRRRKSGVRRVPSARRREGRAVCGNAKSSTLCRRVETGRNVVRKHSLFVSATRQGRSNGLPR